MTVEWAGEWETLAVGELLRAHAAINAELRERGIIRSANQPSGDLAELIAHRMYGGEMAAQSTAGWDIRADDGTTIQVKARRQLSSASHYGFISPGTRADMYVFILFSSDLLGVLHAYEVDADAIDLLAPPGGGQARPGSRRVTFRRLADFGPKREVTGAAQTAHADVLRSHQPVSSAGDASR